MKNVQKFLFLSAFALLLSLGTAQAQVSTSCQNGSCTITTPCETITVPGNNASVSSSSVNGTTTYKISVDGQVVSTCTVDSPAGPAPKPVIPESLCRVFPFLCN